MGIAEISAGRFAEIALALDKNPYAPSMRVETMSTIATLLFEVIALTRLPCEHSPVMSVPGADGLYEFFTRTGTSARRAGSIAAGWRT